MSTGLHHRRVYKARRAGKGQCDTLAGAAAKTSRDFDRALAGIKRGGVLRDTGPPLAADLPGGLVTGRMATA